MKKIIIEGMVAVAIVAFAFAADAQIIKVSKDAEHLFIHASLVTDAKELKILKDKIETLEKLKSELNMEQVEKLNSLMKKIVELESKLAAGGQQVAKAKDPVDIKSLEAKFEAMFMAKSVDINREFTDLWNDSKAIREKLSKLEREVKEARQTADEAKVTASQAEAATIILKQDVNKVKGQLDTKLDKDEAPLKYQRHISFVLGAEYLWDPQDSVVGGSLLLAIPLHESAWEFRLGGTAGGALNAGGVGLAAEVGFAYNFESASGLSLGLAGVYNTQKSDQWATKAHGVGVQLKLVYTFEQMIRLSFGLGGIYKISGDGPVEKVDATHEQATLNRVFGQLVTVGLGIPLECIFSDACKPSPPEN